MRYEYRDIGIERGLNDQMSIYILSLRNRIHELTKPMKYLLLLLPFLMAFSGPVDRSFALPEGTASLKKDAKKLCEHYRQRVLKGESMASIAKLYSEDPGSAPNGGQYDGVVPGMMVAEFEKVAYSLKPGEISEVFETQYGFHFIQLISRRGDTLSLRHLLITRD